MKRSAALLEAARIEIDKVKAIDAAAADSGAEPSRKQKTDRDAHMAKANGLIEQAEGAKADEKMFEELAAFGRTPDADGRHHDPKAAPGAWGKAVVAAGYNPDAKALVPSGTAGVTVPVDRDIVIKGEPVTSVLQLIPARPAPGGRYSYMRQITRTNNAAPTARGATKPVSVYELEKVDGVTSTIAATAGPYPRQFFTEAEMLEAFIEQEMRLGLDLALEGQILAGDGTGANLTGILAASGVQAQAFATDLFTTARKAVTKLQVAGAHPSAWVMTPADWETFELTQDGDDRYFGDGAPFAVGPVDQRARSLWGYPVALSSSMTAGVALLGDFAGSIELRVSDEAHVDWSENVSDDYLKNQVRWRCEGDFGLAITRPYAFCTVDLTA